MEVEASQVFSTRIPDPTLVRSSYIPLPSRPTIHMEASAKAPFSETLDWLQLTILLAPATAAQATQFAEVGSQLNSPTWSFRLQLFSREPKTKRECRANILPARLLRRDLEI